MAEQRTIRTVLELNATRFTAGAAAASASARSLAGDMARLGTAGDGFSQNYGRAGTTLLGFGAAAVGGLGLATKAAMDWESAWAGVTKTVDGTPEQYAALEEQLRGLAKTLPATHEEIAGVAEAAGQLGVAREDIAGFTKVMIDLGETTNLSADEAATAIAQFSNVMGTSSDDVDNFGAALVALGNAGASTEADIMSMASRLAGTGKLIGASEQDILGLSSALADVGISAEAGGGSLSRVLQKMNTAVLEGGDKLQGFADVAGMSAAEFAAAWRQSPIEAFDAFSQGLNGVTQEGGNAIGVLNDLGIKSSEETRALLSLAGAGDHLSQSLATANEGWSQNTALVAEASKRYETSESKIAMAGNSIRDAAIDIGGTLLPAVAAGADGIAGLADAFGNLPGPAKTLIAQLGAVGGVAALTAGGVMKLVPAVADTVGAFQRLKTESPAVASGLGKVGKAAGIVGLALTALTIADAIVLPHVSDGDVTELDAYAAAITRIGNGNTVKGISDLNAAFTSSDWFSGLDVQGLDDAFQIMSDPTAGQNIDNITSKILTLGQRGSSDMEFVTREWEKLDQTLAGMADSGDLDGFRATLEQVAEASGTTVDALLEEMPQASAALENAEAAAEGAANGQDQFGAATQGASGAADEQADSLERLSGLLQDIANLTLDARGSAREFEAAIDDANAATDEYGKNLDITTENGRANADSLDQIASATLAWADAQAKAGGSADELNGIMSQGRDAFIRAAEAKGMDSQAASDLADDIGLVTDAYSAVPDQVETKMVLETTTAEQQTDMLTKKYNGIPPKVLTEAGVEADLSQLDRMNTDLWNFDAQQVTATLDVDTSEGRAALADLEDAIYTSEGTVTINGDPAEGQSALATLTSAINSSNGTVTINGTSVPADKALDTVIGQINSGSGTITIKGNTGPASASVDGVVGKANSSTGTIDVTAATGLANAAIDSAARDRTARINVVATGAVSFANAVLGRADGGWIKPGLSDGGWVPGAYPGAGIDNIMWPLMPGKAGGGVLAQPLAGNEFVVRGSQARMWGPALEAINAGLRPQPVTQAGPSGPLIGALNVAAVEGQSPREQGQYIAGYLGAHLNI